MADVELKSYTTEKDGVKTTVKVREISNGWIVSTCTEGKDKKGNWYYEEKEEYAEKNPLDPAMMKIKIIKDALGKK